MPLALLSRVPALLLSLVALNMTGHLALSGGRVSTSLFALHHGLSESLVGALIALYGVLPMMASLAIGRWVDRVGSLLPMRCGLAAVMVGVMLPAIFPNVWMLFFTATLCGTGFTVVTIAAQHAVGHLPVANSSQRIVFFGWLALGHSVSNVAGPLIAGFAIDHFGHRVAFGILTCFAATAALLLHWKARGLQSVVAEQAQRAAGSIWELLAEGRLRRIYIVGIIISMSWDLFTFLMPVVGHRQGLSAATIGGILSAFAAGTFSVRLVMPILVRRAREWQILRVALAAIALVYGLLPLISSITLLFVAGYVLGAAVGCSQPMMLSLLHNSAPSGRAGEAVGVRAMCGNASGVLVPVLFGTTVATMGLAPVFWAIAGLVVSALPAANRASRDHHC